ncbi:YVTN repeat-like/Quino protein amine dehydrogenase, partial [Ascobolus immersus RN42]
DQQFFRFKSVDNRQQCRPTHFQLRNLLSCNTRNDVYHANGPVVTHMNPTTRSSRILFDLSNYSSSSPIPYLFRITSMTTSKEILVAGGYSGQYALKSLNTFSNPEPTIGIVSSANNGITNHVHLHTSRTSSTPIAVFCSNDNAIRRLDTHTNTFLDTHPFGDIAINCAATSPDTRLRLVVGDSKSVFIVDADRGTILRELKGHTDYGFAAAWSDDGIHVATGNQDMTVRIYDTRKFDEPIKVLQADLAGVRGLRFSPTGMGKKVLAMAEPTDILHIVDADRGMFDREQKWDSFGNIGGIGFTDDGEDLFLANTDRWYGGVVHFERERYQHGRHEESRGWESRAWGRRAWEGHMEELIV